MKIDTTQKGGYSVLRKSDHVVLASHNYVAEAQTDATNRAIENIGEVYLVQPPMIEVIASAPAPIPVPVPTPIPDIDAYNIELPTGIF